MVEKQAAVIPYELGLDMPRFWSNGWILDGREPMRAMTCPYLEYRAESAENSFDTARAHCAITEEFVQPMRADICNDRYDLGHERDCEICRDHERDGDER